MNSQWNIELIRKLIDLYRERPVLWDISLNEFKDRDKKNAAWSEISQSLNMERESVERKMRILVFQFRRELVKLDLSSGVNSKWFAFKPMLFLKSKWAQFDKQRVTAFEKNGTRNVSTEDETWKSPAETSTPKKTPAFNKTVVEYVIEDPISNIPTTTKRKYRDDKSDEGSNTVSRNNVEESSRDEFTIFGEYVATKLRNLGNNFASNTAQYHINNILYNADIGKYNKNESKPSRNSQENCKTEYYDEEVEFEEVDVP